MELLLLEASQSAVVAEGPALGLVISVSAVGISSSEISLTPDFVISTLLVGIVCPNCHGHLVPIMVLGPIVFTMR